MRVKPYKGNISQNKCELFHCYGRSSRFTMHTVFHPVPVSKIILCARKARSSSMGILIPLTRGPCSRAVSRTRRSSGLRTRPTSSVPCPSFRGDAASRRRLSFLGRRRAVILLAEVRAAAAGRRAHGAPRAPPRFGRPDGAGGKPDDRDRGASRQPPSVAAARVMPHERERPAARLPHSACGGDRRNPGPPSDAAALAGRWRNLDPDADGVVALAIETLDSERLAMQCKTSEPANDGACQPDPGLLPRRGSHGDVSPSGSVHHALPTPGGFASSRGPAHRRAGRKHAGRRHGPPGVRPRRGRGRRPR